MEKTVHYHAVEVRFNLSDRELPDMFSNGCYPDQKKRLDDPDDPVPPNEILAEMIKGALTGNEMGNPRIEDLRVSVDGVLSLAFDGPCR